MDVNRDGRLDLVYADAGIGPAAGAAGIYVAKSSRWGPGAAG